MKSSWYFEPEAQQWPKRTPLATHSGLWEAKSQASCSTPSIPDLLNIATAMDTHIRMSVLTGPRSSRNDAGAAGEMIDIHKGKFCGVSSVVQPGSHSFRRPVSGQ